MAFHCWVSHSPKRLEADVAEGGCPCGGCGVRGQCNCLDVPPVVLTREAAVM